MEPVALLHSHCMRPADGCIHCHRRRCEPRTRDAGATTRLPPTQVQLRYCHPRRYNCADCRCAAVTAIRHPARARSQLLRLPMGWHVLWSQWRCSIPTACDLRTAAFTATDADASRALATQVQLRDCHRRRCNCATATAAGATARLPPTQLQQRRLPQIQPLPSISVLTAATIGPEVDSAVACKLAASRGGARWR